MKQLRRWGTYEPLTFDWALRRARQLANAHREPAVVILLTREPLFDDSQFSAILAKRALHGDETVMLTVCPALWTRLLHRPKPRPLA